MHLIITLLSDPILLRAIVNHWTGSIKEIISLEIAVLANPYIRKLFLEKSKNRSSYSCITKTIKLNNTIAWNGYLKWMRNRRTMLDSMEVSGVKGHLLDLVRISHCHENLCSLKISNVTLTITEIQIIISCKALDSLSFHHVKCDETPQSAIKAPRRSSTSLHTLSLIDIKVPNKELYELLFVRCPLIVELTIQLCSHVNTAFLLDTLLPHLRHLEQLTYCSLFPNPIPQRTFAGSWKPIIQQVKDDPDRKIIAAQITTKSYPKVRTLTIAPPEDMRVIHYNDSLHALVAFPNVQELIINGKYIVDARQVRKEVVEEWIRRRIAYQIQQKHSQTLLSKATTPTTTTMTTSTSTKGSTRSVMEVAVKYRELQRVHLVFPSYVTNTVLVDTWRRILTTIVQSHHALHTVHLQWHRRVLPKWVCDVLQREEHCLANETVKHLTLQHSFPDHPNKHHRDYLVTLFQIPYLLAKESFYYLQLLSDKEKDKEKASSTPTAPDTITATAPTTSTDKTAGKEKGEGEGSEKAAEVVEKAEEGEEEEEREEREKVQNVSTMSLLMMRCPIHFQFFEDVYYPTQLLHLRIEIEHTITFPQSPYASLLWQVFVLLNHVFTNYHDATTGNITMPQQKTALLPQIQTVYVHIPRIVFPTTSQECEDYSILDDYRNIADSMILHRWRFHCPALQSVHIHIPYYHQHTDILNHHIPRRMIKHCPALQFVHLLLSVDPTECIEERGKLALQERISSMQSKEKVMEGVDDISIYGSEDMDMDMDDEDEYFFYVDSDDEDN